MAENEGENQEKPTSSGKDGKFDYLVIGTGLCESMSPCCLRYRYYRSPGRPQQFLWPVVGSCPSRSTPIDTIPPLLLIGSVVIAGVIDRTSSKFIRFTVFRTSDQQTSTIAIRALSSTDPRPARGKFVDALIASNVAPYLSFQLLHAFILAQPDHTLLPLPGSKHDLFRMSELSLLDKRLLMRFFQAILDPDRLLLPAAILDHQSQIDYCDRRAGAFANNEPAAAPVLSRLKTLLSAIGRHPSSTVSALPAALLLGEYGGGGEWAEGFVRAAAVTGRATQVLGRPVFPCNSPPTILNTDGTSDSAHTICRAIAIVGRSGLDKLHRHEKGENIEPRGSHALIVFPPGDDDNNGQQSPVHALIVDEQIIYLSSIVTSTTDPSIIDPTRLLEPILDRLLRSASTSDTPMEFIRYSKFYNQPVLHLPDPSSIPNYSWIIPSWPVDIERSGLTEVVEWITETALDLYKLASTFSTDAMPVE
ncbi:hypothetical protein H4Q26_005339 [Puccinia striiformis f. sp. tritici PST-130]|nr:hypothetical protein H4Q26_005339 [Puccinia striiformis f. sp. tritici PST-130]